MKTLLADLKLFLFLTLMSLLVFFADQIQLLNVPKSIIQTATIPVQYGLYKTNLNITNKFAFISMARQAYLENRALKKQLADLIAEKALMQKRLKETEDLVDQYNKLSPETYELVPARVIGIGRYLTIDKGSEAGLVKNQVVVFKDNYIGKIENLTPKSAQVVLSIDPQSKIAVFSQNKDGRAKGILQGQFGSELLMDKILHVEVVTVDDLVYSEGTEGELPKGLVMGKVTEVYEKQNEVFKQAMVEPIYKPVDLDTVFIIQQ